MLYTLTSQAEQLQIMLLQGDITEECFRDTIEAMGGEWNIEELCKMIRNAEAEADALKAEKERFDARMKAAKNSTEKLKSELKSYMAESKQNKVEAGTFKVLLKNAADTIEVTDESKIPIDLKRVKTSIEVDKAAIKKAIKEGQEVAGVKVITGNKSLTIM